MRVPSWLATVALVATCTNSCQHRSDALRDPDSLAAIREVDRAATKAREWLATVVTQGDWGKATGVELAKRQVTTLMVAYVHLFATDGGDEPGHREAILQLADGICRIESADYACWKEGFSSIYLFEAVLRGREVRALAEANVARIIALQNAEGGWAHTGKASRFSYPTTVLASANLALIGLGAARQLQLEIAESGAYRDAVERALHLYRSIQAPGGSLPYGGPAYQVGHQAARTSGALLGLAALGEAGSPLFRKARSYCLKNVNTIPYGHASPALNTALGGLSFGAQSRDHWEQFRDGPIERLLEHQQTDGSFKDVAKISPDSMNLGVSSLTDDAYRTAMYLVALTADRSSIGRSLRPSVGAEAGAPGDTLEVKVKELHRLASQKVDRTLGVTAWRNRLLCVREEGDLCVVDPKTLAVVDRVATGIAGFKGLVLRGDQALIRSTDGEQVAIDLDELKIVHRRTLGSPRAKVAYGSGYEVEMASDGTVSGRKAGSAEGGWSTELELRSISSRLVASDLGVLAIATGDTLHILDIEGGEELWHVRLDAAEGLTGPTIFGVAFVGQSILVAGSDGLVRSFAMTNGKPEWRVAGGSGLLRLTRVPGEGSNVVAFSADGRMLQLANGAPTWELDLLRGAERFRQMEVERAYGRIAAAATRVAVRAKPRNELLVVDTTNGTIVGQCEAPNDDRHWTLSDEVLVVLRDNGQRLEIFALE